MITFSEFKKIFLENLYSYNTISDEIINNDYELFTENFNTSKNIARKMLTIDGFSISKKTIDDAMKEIDMKIIKDAIITFIEDLYGNEYLDGAEMCLTNKLINSACQIKSEKDLYGVVRGYDEKNKRKLIIDIGEIENIKVDIEDLRIVGQKN